MVSTQWSRTTKRLVIVGLLIVLLLLLYVFRAVVPPVAIALVLAYILKPFADLVQRRLKIPRTLAVLLVFLLLLILLSIIPVTIVPWAVDRVTRLNLDLQQLLDDLVAFLSEPFYVFGYWFNFQDLVGDVQSAIQDLLRPFASQTVSLLFDVASSVLWVVSIFVISFYVVKDADKLRHFLDRMAPPGYTDELSHLRENINHVWKAFFRGQVVLGIVVGLVVWIAMSLLGLPNAGLMGLVAGLLEVIPNFGPVLATIPALLSAFFLGSTYLPLNNFWFTLLVLGTYIIIQQVENAYLVPRIMGRRMQIHPLAIFIGVLAGGMVAGVLGVLLAAPVMGTLRVVLSYVYAKILDQDPFPPEPSQDGELYPGEIDAIFFDLDGTLIETDDVAVETLARRLKPLQRLIPGRDPIRAARSILMAIEGPANSFLTVLDRVGLDDNLFDMGDRISRIRGLDTPINFRPVDGVSEMLDDLTHRYHLAIVTTRSRVHAEAFIAQQNLGDQIEVITGREDTFRIKPHPSPITHTAERLEIPVERCLMVGDTTADIWAARAAGARSVGVLCGFGSQNELERAGADMTIQTTSELRDWM